MRHLLGSLLMIGTLALCGCFEPAKGDRTDGAKADEKGDPNATYTMKIRAGEKRDKYRATFNASMTFTTSWVLHGRPDKQTQLHGRNYEYVHEPVEARYGTVSDFRRTFMTAERTQNGTRSNEAFQNKAVLIKKENDGYSFALEDGTAVYSEHLHDEFNLPNRPSRRELFPDGPVKLNETWTIKKDVAVRVFAYPDGLPIDSDNVHATGKLTRVFQRDGRTLGVIELHSDIPIAAKEYMGGRIKPGGKFVIDTTVTLCIDGSSSDMEQKGKLKVDATVVAPPEPGTLAEVQIHAEGTVSATEKSVP